MFFSFVKSDKIILTKFLTLEKAASKVNKDAVFKTIKLQFIIYLLFASALSPNSFRSGPLIIDHSCCALPWEQNIYSMWCQHPNQITDRDWSIFITTPAIGWHFSIRASSENRQRFTTEDVLAQIENVNDMDSDRGGMDSGEGSEIDRQLLNFDEELRWMWIVLLSTCGHYGSASLLLSIAI